MEEEEEKRALSVAGVTRARVVSLGRGPLPFIDSRVGNEELSATELAPRRMERG